LRLNSLLTCWRDCIGNKLTSLAGAPQKVGRFFKCDAFELEKKEWNLEGWLKALKKESRAAQKIILTLLPAEYLNKERERIPSNILTKEPSAELRPDQKDSDSLPIYPILDGILRLYIEERKGKDEIILEGYDASTVSRIINLVNANEYKRYQAPPIIRVSSKAFGKGRIMPLVAKYS
jgi:hypothetical protein